jgi:hypothetical protein
MLWMCILYAVPPLSSCRTLYSSAFHFRGCRQSIMLFLARVVECRNGLEQYCLFSDRFFGRAAYIRIDVLLRCSDYLLHMLCIRSSPFV